MARVTSLGRGGKKLWKDITDLHELDPTQEAQLLEACRAKDRLDDLHEAINECESVDPDWHSALKSANATANLMKQLLAAMRLPDAETGKRPQYRGPRGAQKPSGSSRTDSGKVSSLARAREARARGA